MSIHRIIADHKKSHGMTRFNAQTRNPVVLFGYLLVLGGFSINRFLLGQRALDILKLITIGGFCVWVLIA